jgi:hypothetical protein
MVRTTAKDAYHHRYKTEKKRVPHVRIPTQIGEASALKPSIKSINGCARWR